jgi:type II secretory pathway component PulF
MKMTEPQATAETRLSIAAAASEAVLECTAAIATSGMPLPAGLRAAAQEAASARVATGLRSLAAELERGRSLSDCLASAPRLPPYVAGLIRAAQGSGDIGLTLAAWTANRRSARQYWRATLAALAYPGIAVAMAIAVFLLFGLLIIPIFRTLYAEFGLKLPMPTIYLFRTAEFAMVAFPLLALFAVSISIGARLFGGRAGWSFLIANLPLIGSAWHWTGVAEMLRCLELLVERHVPLPAALRLTAAGLRDAYVSQQCSRLATSIEEGRSLTMALVGLRTLPLSIVPLVRCGEQQEQLAPSLRSAAEMLENRLKVRTHVVAQIVPPLVFVFVGVCFASAIIALYLPMISLIQGLS